MTAVTAEPSGPYPPLLPLISALAYLGGSWVGMIGLGILLGWILVALGAPWLAPFPPNATLLPFAPPGVAPQLTVVSAPPRYEAFQRMRGTPTLLGWCPARRWYMKRRVFRDG